MIIAPFCYHSPFTDPSISVSMGSPSEILGSAHYLTCIVTGAESLADSTIAYQWFMDGEVVSDQTTRTLSFPSLSLSDAGHYTCWSTVMSSLLSGSISSSSSVVLHLTSKSLNSLSLISSLCMTLNSACYFTSHSTISNCHHHQWYHCCWNSCYSDLHC